MSRMTLILLCLLSLQSIARRGQKKEYSALRLEGPAPTIDGILEEPLWQEGPWEGGFIQHEPLNGRAAPQPTEFKIFFDDNNLYVAIKAYDSSPDSIVRRLTRRDNEDGDGVGVAFDSYFDQRTAFVFAVTASGVKYDWILSNDGETEDKTWDPNWWVKVSINPEGWVAEMRIPLSQVRFEKDGSGVWGLQVFRSIHRHKELDFWNHIPKDAAGMVRYCGLLKGLENLEPRKTLDATPYAVASISRYPIEEDNPFSSGKDHALKAGLDAKIGLSNNFTMDLTLNPDFGQVEADPSEVNLSAYETFFEEKRPFFIEGRNISNFFLGIGDGGLGNDNLFYSRRIGRRPQGEVSVNGDSYVDRPPFTRILGAAKVTGRNDRGLSIAFIETVTAEETAAIDLNGQRSEETVEPLSNFFVGRLQKEIKDGNTLFGAILTGVNRKLDSNLETQMHREAFSGGIDFTQYFKEKSWMFNVNMALSHVAGHEEAILETQRSPSRYFQRPDASHLSLDPSRTSLTGSGGRMQFLRLGGGHWTYLAAVVWKSPGFEINDLGYMREADQVIPLVYAGYREWEPGSFYQSFTLNLSLYGGWNFAGERIALGINPNGNILFKNYWQANAGGEYSLDIVSMNHLRGGPSLKLPDAANIWFGMRTDNRKKWYVGFSNSLSLGAEQYQRHLNISPYITYMPFDNVSFSLNPYFYNGFETLQYVDELDFNSQPRYVYATINQQVASLSFRVNYTILPDLTIQYWGQPFVAAGKYTDFKYITDPQAREFSDRYQEYLPAQVSWDEDDYFINEDLTGDYDYSFEKPDFHFREFLSNLVIRWEYNPGSSLFLVWSQNRNDFENQGEMDFLPDTRNLFKEKGSNIFLVKLSYRIGMR